MKYLLEKGDCLVARIRIGVNIVIRILGRTVMTKFEMKTFNLLVGGVAQYLCITSKALSFSNNS